MLVSPLIQAVKELYKLVIDRLDGQDRQIASVIESIKVDKLQIETLNKQVVEFKDKTHRLEAENAALKAYLCSKDSKAPICK